ncbi:kinase-like domain-containing protein [Trametes meyenii]|nr:kinase-like domain-containing protein [Trametes meyenii]
MTARDSLAEAQLDPIENSFIPVHELDKPYPNRTAPMMNHAAELSPSPISVPSEIPRKSIRTAAMERKARLTSTSAEDGIPAISTSRTRHTKLWGSSVEGLETVGGRKGPQSKSGPSKASSYSDGTRAASDMFRWVKGELISEGVYGKTYLAMDATTGELITAKQADIPDRGAAVDEADRLGDPPQVSALEALKRESEILKDVNHPNVILYLGREETPKFFSVFMEYLPGGSVENLLRKYGWFEDTLVSTFIRQIVTGLEYLHSHGIVHGDLCARNILVGSDGTCKIANFEDSQLVSPSNEYGEAERVSLPRSTSLRPESAFYMAPELIRPRPEEGDPKGDIWSLGCVAVEMWTGERPWVGMDVETVLAKIDAKEISPIPARVQLSEPADDFRRRSFSYDLKERPSASELLKHPYLTHQAVFSET